MIKIGLVALSSGYLEFEISAYAMLILLILELLYNCMVYMIYKDS